MVCAPLDAINRWDSEKSREPARNPGDPVFSILLALVRIPCEAIFAKRLPSGTHALESLVHLDRIALRQIVHSLADLDDPAHDFVAQDLRGLG